MNPRLMQYFETVYDLFLVRSHCVNISSVADFARRLCCVRPIHAARPDATKLFRRIASGRAVYIGHKV